MRMDRQSLFAIWRNEAFFFIVAPCILIPSKHFIYQQLHFISVVENIKIYINIYIKTAPTCFGVRPLSESLHMSLATVTFIKSVKVRRYGICCCVAACYIKSNSMVMCVLCAVQSKTLHSTQHTPPWTWYNMLPYNRIVQRFSNCGPRTTSCPRVLPLWSF